MRVGVENGGKQQRLMMIIKWKQRSTVKSFARHLKTGVCFYLPKLIRNDNC